MKNFIFLSVLLLSSISLAAMEVVDVKRNIPLSETETVYKDYYIKDVSGLKKNLVVKAVRKITVADRMMKPLGDFTTVVGLLKIIQVSDSVAVAREFKLIPRTDEPMIEQIGIMVGDEIDLSNSFTDTSKPAEKKTAVIVPVPVEKPVDIPLEKTATAAEPQDI